MTFVAGDSFNQYNGMGTGVGLRGSWTMVGAGSSASSLVADAYGGQAFRAAGGITAFRNTAFNKVFLPTPTGTFSVGFGMIMYLYTGVSLTFGDGLNCQFALTLNADGSISIGRYTSMTTSGGTFTTIATTAPGVFTTGVRFECTLICNSIHASTGSMELQVEGVSVGTFTGLNNKSYAGSANVNSMGLMQSTSSAAATFDITDIRWNDTNAALPLMRARPVLLTGDTAQKDFTPNTGSTNYTQIDETTASASDYVQGSTVGQIDRYTKQAVATALGFSPSAIYGVQLVGFGMRTDVGSRAINLSLHDGSTYSDGSNLVLPQTPGSRLDRLMAVNPYTGVAWTPSDLDALAPALKVAA